MNIEIEMCYKDLISEVVYLAIKDFVNLCMDGKDHKDSIYKDQILKSFYQHQMIDFCDFLEIDADIIVEELLNKEKIISNARNAIINEFNPDSMKNGVYRSNYIIFTIFKSDVRHYVGYFVDGGQVKLISEKERRDILNLGGINERKRSE